MISDRQLAKLSFTIAALGVLILFLFTHFSEPPTVAISDIDQSMLGFNVIVEGTVESISEKNNNIFFILSDGESEIKAVMFRNSMENMNISSGDRISVKGEINLYKNELEIIVNEIKEQD